MAQAPAPRNPRTRPAARAPAGVAACLGDLGGAPFCWEGVVATRLNSRIHRATRGSESVAIKECFDPSMRKADPTSAQREFDALRRLAATARARSGSVLAPQPLTIRRELGTYAMSWIPGTPATRVILERGAAASAARIGTAAGRWLGEFHALHPLPPRRNDFETKLGFVVEFADAARDRLMARARETLVATAAAAADTKLPASWIHGDMKSDNLLVDGGAVAGLDVQMADENTVVYDLAPFVNHLGLLRWSARGLGRAPALRAAASHFLSAYSPEAARWALPIAWLRAYLLMHAIARVSSGTTVHARLAAWPVRRELAAVLAALAS